MHRTKQTLIDSTYVASHPPGRLRSCDRIGEVQIAFGMATLVFPTMACLFKKASLHLGG